ncbi:hypothetical protein D3C73_1519500 [compost metagenome]
MLLPSSVLPFCRVLRELFRTHNVPFFPASKTILAASGRGSFTSSMANSSFKLTLRL